MNSSIFNSKQFPKAFLTAFLLALLTIVVMVCFLRKTDALPAPMFTGRYSLDEKIRFMRMNDPSRADFAVLGSSSGLNNLSGEVIFNNPNIGKSYYNFSAWGLHITHLAEYWNFLKTLTNPKVMVLYINVFDFKDSKVQGVISNETDLRRYVKGGPTWWYYFKYHKSGLGERIQSVGRRRTTNNHFDSLQYDEGGNVLLEMPHDKAVQNDWPDQLENVVFDEVSYRALDEMLTSMRDRGTVAVVVQGPLREQYSDSEPKLEYIKRHWERVESITEEHDMYFFNMHGMFYPEETFFTDTIHLNREGAETFTKKLLERIEEAKIFQRVKDR